MSYEILYGRQFVSLGNGRYIPMILSGSNNCTMFVGGREVLERHWWPLFTDRLAGATADELIFFIDSRTAEYPASEWFKSGGRWLHGKNMVNWCKSGIKSARTIEEIREIKPYQSLYCHIDVYDGNKGYGESGYHTQEHREIIKTTEDLLKWLDKFAKRKENKLENESVYMNIEFSGIEPLKLGTKVKKDEPVICKIGSKYLSEFKIKESSSEYSYSPDVSQAIVFGNEDDFREKTKGLRIENYRLAKATIKFKAKNANFIIAVADGCYSGWYVWKKTRTGVRITRYENDAKKFQTENQARKYIENMLQGKFEKCKNFLVRNIATKSEE